METTLDLRALELAQEREAKLSGVSNVVAMEQRDPRILQAVVRLKLRRLAIKGVNAKDAAAVVAMHPNTVRAIYRDPMFKQEVFQQVNGAFEDIDSEFAEKQMTLHESIESLAWDAFALFKDKMLGDSSLSDWQRAKLAEGVLDRVQETSKVTRSVSLPSMQASDLARAARGATEMQLALDQRLKRA